MRETVTLISNFYVHHTPSPPFLFLSHLGSQEILKWCAYQDRLEEKKEGKPRLRLKTLQSNCWNKIPRWDFFFFFFCFARRELEQGSLLHKSLAVWPRKMFRNIFCPNITKRAHFDYVAKRAFFSYIFFFLQPCVSRCPEAAFCQRRESRQTVSHKTSLTCKHHTFFSRGSYTAGAPSRMTAEELGVFLSPKRETHVLVVVPQLEIHKFAVAMASPPFKN